MKQIAKLVLGLMVLLISAQAKGNDCTQSLGKAKKFVRCGKAVVQADIPPNERNFLIEKYQESRILSGDLNLDGINDFVVYSTEHTGNGVADRVVMLKGKSGGGSEPLAKSSVIQYGTANIEIRNNSLYLQIDHNSTSESHAEIYQFKYRDGDVFLIGKEEISYAPVDENRGSESRTSTNFLTGEEIRIERTDGKITRESKAKVDRKLLRLEEFSR
jgi:hypothetical protein